MISLLKRISVFEKADVLRGMFGSRRWPALTLAVLAVATCGRALAGTWTPLAHAPPAGLNNGLLLTDGTVMCGDGGSGWYRLTPDIHGSYVNGTWTQLASTHYTRLFYSSDVLTNGNVYVAGGEYGTGTAHAEMYNSLQNFWTDVPQPAANPSYSDATSKILPNGNVLQGTTGSGVWIFSPTTNTIVAAATAAHLQDESCWVKLTNDTVLTVDGFGQTAEHYVPSLNTWVADPNTPLDLYGYGAELGPAFVLPNGKVFCIGASTHTAIYTPGSTAASAGSWVSGPEMMFGTNALGGVDAPAAMMANGKILCALASTNGFASPTTYYEYDYISNNFTQVNGPTGLSYNAPTFVTTMLDLPDGNILFFGGQNSTTMYVYTPDGSPLAAGQPVINTITENTNGSYHLSGTGLTGITGGAAYGDDWQMDTSYPLVRLTNNVSGNVYYARTYGWSTTSIMTGSRVVTTEFTLPVGLPAGMYSLVVAANGNASSSVTLTYSPPVAPTGLSAIIGNGQLALSWNGVSGATDYNVLRSTTSGGPYTTVATVPGTNYLDTGLTNGLTYYYVLTAVGSGGPSAYSAQLAAAPFGPPPAPTGLTAGPDSYVGVTLSWNTTPGAASYNVKRSTLSGGPYGAIASRANPNYNDTNVFAGTTYFYVVSAVSAGGESPNSTQAAATPLATGDVTSGLVANWRFDDGTGTTAVDSSGNNNTGTLVNGPTWVAPGRIGPSALSFVSTNLQYVTVANSATLNMTTMSITAWINVTDWGGNRRIVQKGNSDNQYRFLAENGVFKFHLNGVNTVTTALPASNVWVHVAATWNGSTMVIYTNGEPAASMAASGAVTTTADPLTIATKNGSGTSGDFFNGRLDEVRIYNRALSLPEINTVMHAGDAAPATPTGLSVVASNAQVNLSWTPSGAASSYNVKRSTLSGGPYAVVGNPFGSTYADTGLTNGTTYYYVVSAVNFTNESANSSQISARPAMGVIFFQDIYYGGAAGQVLGAGNYTLSQLNAAGIPNDWASSCNVPNGWTVIVYQDDGYGGTSWTLTNDTPNFTDYSGLNDNMSSCKIIAGSTPPAPGGLNAAAGDTQVGLSWNASSGALFYNLKRSTNNGGPYTVLVSTAAKSYTDTGLANGTTYYYVVSAVNGTGEGANSSQVSATPFPAPILLSVLPPANGQFVFQFQGVDGRNYIVQLSTDLVSWLPIFTNQTVGGEFLYTNTNAAPAAFFRVMQ